MRLQRSRLTDEQSERLLENFVAGTPARAAAAAVRVNRNTARLFYHRVRKLIAQQLEKASPYPGEIPPTHPDVANAAKRDAARRTAIEYPVFGLLARDDKVYTVLIDGNHAGSRPPEQDAGVHLNAIVFYADRGRRGALDVSAFRHQRVGAEIPAREQPPVDSVENFWSQAKRHLRRYTGIPRHHFPLFLKECEWRFNYGPPAQLPDVLKGWIKPS